MPGPFLGAGYFLSFMAVPSVNQKDLIEFKNNQKRHILVSTPNRLSYCIKEQNREFLRDIRYVVMDECDKLFENRNDDAHDSFLSQIDEILSACESFENHYVQKILASATLPPYIEELAQTILNDPIKIIVGQKYDFHYLFELNYF